jgi:hypothetical protein
MEVQKSCLVERRPYINFNGNLSQNLTRARMRKIGTGQTILRKNQR